MARVHLRKQKASNYPKDQNISQKLHKAATSGGSFATPEIGGKVSRFTTPIPRIKGFNVAPNPSSYYSKTPA